MSESDRVLRVCKNFVCVKKKNTRKHFSIMALDFLCMQPIETCAAIPTAVFCYMHTHIYKSTQRSCLAGIRNAFKKNSNGSMSAVYVVWFSMVTYVTISRRALNMNGTVLNVYIYIRFSDEKNTFLFVSCSFPLKNCTKSVKCSLNNIYNMSY